MKKLYTVILIFISMICLMGVTARNLIYNQGREVSIGYFSNDFDYAVSQISTDEFTLVIDTNIVITQDTTCPATMGLKINKGGLLTPDDPNVDLVINGNFEAGLYQCFDPNTSSGADAGDWISFGDGVVDIFYSEWWGAAGDNSTNCETAIKRAFTAASGATLKFLEGTYDCNEGTYAFPTDIKIIGAGPGKTILQDFRASVQTGINNFVLRDIELQNVSNYFKDCNNILINNVKFENYDPNNSNGLFVRTWGCHHVTVHNCSFKNFQAAIYIDDPAEATRNNKNVYIENNYFYNTKNYDYPACINIAAVDGARIIGNKGENITTDNNGYFFYQGDNVVHTCRDIKLIGNESYNIDYYHYFIHNADDVVIADNIVKQGTTENAINFQGDTDPIDSSLQERITIINNIVHEDILLSGNVKDVIISGNIVNGGTWGIALYGTTGTNVIISDNIIKDSDQTGIICYAVTSCIVSGNQILNCNQDNSSGWNYAGISHTGSDNTITVNNYIANTDSNGHIKHGIYYSSIATAPNHIYYNNKFEGIETDIIYGDYTAAPTAGTWMGGDRIDYVSFTKGAASGLACISSGTFSSATDPNGDTDPNSVVPAKITGMADVSDFNLREWVTVSAGFPSATTPYLIIDKDPNNNTLTLNTDATSTQTNVTVATVDPVFAEYGIIELEGSTTWDPGDLADGAGETSSGITVTGAALGDYCICSAPYDLRDMIAACYVQAANTVEIRLQNESSDPNIDLASGTWKVRIIK